MKCQHVPVPIDFSQDSEHAVDSAVGLAQQFQARVTLLHAIYVPEAAEVNLAAYMDKIRSEADQSMASRLKRVQEAGIAAEAFTVIGTPSQTIVDTAPRPSCGPHCHGNPRPHRAAAHAHRQRS